MRIKIPPASPHPDNRRSGRCSYFHNFMVEHESHSSDGEVKMKETGVLGSFKCRTGIKVGWENKRWEKRREVERWGCFIIQIVIRDDVSWQDCTQWPWIPNPAVCFCVLSSQTPPASPSLWLFSSYFLCFGATSLFLFALKGRRGEAATRPVDLEFMCNV